MSNINTNNLANTLRPTVFDNYVGNTEVITNIKALLAGDKLPQAILITGKAGNGKTSLARLIAKAYLCEGDIKPCNVCATCKQLDDYILSGDTNLIEDLHEINGADKRKVEDMAELIELIKSPRFSTNWQVWIIDECHRLSKEAQSLLLKLVEEPPVKTLFVFCTTDPGEMLDTLRSRMNVTYNVTLSRKDIMNALTLIAKKSEVKYQQSGLRLIAKYSNNIFRKALNDVEALINSGQDLTLTSVQGLYGDVDINVVTKIIKAYLNKNLSEFMVIFEELQDAYSLEKIHQALLEAFRVGISTMYGVPTENEDHAKELYKNTFKELPLTDITDIYQILVKSNSDNIFNELILLLLKRISTVPTSKTTSGTQDVELTDTNIGVLNSPQEDKALAETYEAERQKEREENAKKAIDEQFQTVELKFE